MMCRRPTGTAEAEAGGVPMEGQGATRAETSAPEFEAPQGALARLAALLASRLPGTAALDPRQRVTLFTMFRARTDRVIAVGRLLLALGALYITYLDAAHPPVSPFKVRILLLVYLVHAIVAVWTTWRTEVAQVRGTLVRHVLDILFLAAILYLSDGPSDPFLFFIPFSLLVGTLHWRWRGALWTSLVLAALLAPILLTTSKVTLDLDSDATADASLAVFMVVSAVLLIWLGAHEEAIRADLLRLVERTPDVPRSGDWPAAAALDYAAHVMRVRRAALVWSDGREPWTYLATWHGGRTAVERLPPDLIEPWTAAELATASFLHLHGDEAPAFVHHGDGRFASWQPGKPALHPTLVAEIGNRPVVTVAFQARETQARLFLIDPLHLTLDQVAVAEIVADRVAALFDQAALLARLSEAAVAEQRERIGRDLHDGVLQVLAGTALQLEALRTAQALDPGQLDARVRSIQALLAEEQRELRAFVKNLQPERAEAASPAVDARQHFEKLVRRLGKQWPVDLALTLEPEGFRLPQAVALELTRLASEAVANAVRHGAATRIDIRLLRDAEGVNLVVEDDGSGFPLSGSLGDEELWTRRLGPRSLQARTRALGGRLRLDQGTATRIEIALPVEGAPA